MNGAGRWEDNKGWLFVLPVVAIVAFNAFLPLMTVLNFSVQTTMMGKAVPKGMEHYDAVLSNPAVHWAFLRQLAFSGAILAIQIPLGIAVSLLVPRRGLSSGLCLVVLAIPLLVPFSVVGYTWQVFAEPEVGLLGRSLNAFGWEFNSIENRFDAWFTLILMDVWHWTSLVVLLCFAGLRAIPEAYYRAAAIDGASRWAVFRHVQLPRLRSVLAIAVLLRFMDSFMIFTEPFILNAGGPGSSTTMLSLHLYTEGYRNPTSGPAAAYSICYLALVLGFSYLLYTVMMRLGRGRGEQTAG